MHPLTSISKNAKRFGLETKRLNKTTLQIYNKKFINHSWLVKKEGKRLRLMHMNKRFGNQKCTYHTQKMMDASNWFWVIQKVLDHDEHIIHYKWNARENLVDKVLREYKEGRKNVKKRKR